MNIENFRALCSNVNVELYYSSYFNSKNKDWQHDGFITGYEQFFLFLEGSCEIAINGTPFFPRAGQLVYIPKNSRFSYKKLPGTEFKKYWCHFNADAAERPILSFFKTTLLIEPDGKSSKGLKRLFKDIGNVSSYAEGPADALARNGFVNNIIAQYLSCAGCEFYSSDDEKGMENVINYMLNNLSRDIGLEELAAVAKLHPNYFINKFKKYYGTSPMHFMSKMRIEKAEKLLLSSDLSIGEIALCCGFADRLYFSTAFKNQTGCSPTGYKKMHS